MADDAVREEGEGAFLCMSDARFMDVGRRGDSVWSVAGQGRRRHWAVTGRYGRSSCTEYLRARVELFVAGGRTRRAWSKAQQLPGHLG